MIVGKQKKKKQDNGGKPQQLGYFLLTYFLGLFQALEGLEKKNSFGLCSNSSRSTKTLACGVIITKQEKKVHLFFSPSLFTADTTTIIKKVL